ncbi:hypothetical protein Hanom_Chr17g01591481 [Helianthus anomalus]
MKSALKKPNVQDDGFTVINRKKSKVKWAPLNKKDVNRLIYGPKADGAGPSGTASDLDKGHVVDEAKSGPKEGNGVRIGPVKPSEKAAGLKRGNESVRSPLEDPGPNKNDAAVSKRDGLGPVPVINGADFPPLGCDILGGQKTTVGPGPAVKLTRNKSPKNMVDVTVGRPYTGLINDPVLEPVLPKDGTGYFDTTVGLRTSPSLNTKNTFDVLRGEVEHFDTKRGLWDHEVEIVKKYSSPSSNPPDVIYEAWNENMKKFYQELTKKVVNSVGKNADDEVEVDSETDETARFMKINS